MADKKDGENSDDEKKEVPKKAGAIICLLAVTYWVELLLLAVWFWMLFPCGCLILDAFFLWLFVNFVCFVCFHHFCFCLLLLLFWGDVLLFVLAWFGFWHGFTFTRGGMEWQLVIYLLFCLLIVTCMKQEVFVFGLTFSHFQKKWVYSDYRDHWMRSVKLELIDIKPVQTCICNDVYKLANC